MTIEKNRETELRRLKLRLGKVRKAIASPLTPHDLFNHLEQEEEGLVRRIGELNADPSKRIVVGGRAVEASLLAGERLKKTIVHLKAHVEEADIIFEPQREAILESIRMLTLLLPENRGKWLLFSGKGQPNHLFSRELDKVILNNTEITK